MAHKYSSLRIVVVFLLLSLTPHTICQITENYSPLDFLMNLNGTQHGVSTKGLLQLKKYLTNLGYIEYHNNIPKNSLHRNDDFFDDTLELAIKRYQQFYNLKITGYLDSETVNLMLQPRCGVPDFVTNPVVLNHSFTTFGSSPHDQKRIINYLTFSYPKDTNSTRTDGFIPIASAFIEWSKVSPFGFRYTNRFFTSDIRIRFKAFDGRNGIVSHALKTPGGSWRIEFDGDEKWSDDIQEGRLDIQNVAEHEIGHILGLGHSREKDSVMYPYFKVGQDPKYFSPDDVRKIHSMYPNN